jgi:hypothetical protein
MSRSWYVANVDEKKKVMKKQRRSKKSGLKGKVISCIKIGV